MYMYENGIDDISADGKSFKLKFRIKKNTHYTKKR